MLEDAAHELFLEQGYAATTVDQIAQRAGVGRNTFFNYFGAKSDVLWADVDDALAALPPSAELRGDDDPIDAVRTALLEAADTMPAHRVPWAVSQSELLGLGAELASSGVHRLARLTEWLGSVLSSRPERPSVTERAAAHALAGAALAGAIDWVRAGRGRSALRDHLAPALEPVCTGFSAGSGCRTA
ncbi:Transcriptional regulator, TetR family [Mycetocola reblochoni REB411]|uniref:Transcriptional regulator, TetR family n=2 Tax=Mycetocola reblochoni TaxID=331618 RepID=A0A1R4JEE2_9MICO|nr:Transcriptional regulator, TetR family [Mycetocola reblochoni REB411]